MNSTAASDAELKLQWHNIFAVCFYGTSITYSAVAYAVHRRRHLFPIKERQPHLCIAYNLIAALFGVSTVPYWDGEPCFITQLLGDPAIVLSFLTLTIRAWVLLMQWHIALDILTVEQAPQPLMTALAEALAPAGSVKPHAMQLNSRAGENKAGESEFAQLAVNTASDKPKRLLLDWRQSWWTRNRHLMSVKWQWRIFLVFLVWTMLYSLGCMPLLDVPHPCGPASASGVALASVLTLATAFVYLFGLLYILYKLRAFQYDGYGIKFELQLFIVAASVVVVLFVPIDIGIAALPAWFPMDRLVLWLAGAIFVSITSIRPLVWSYRHERLQQSTRTALQKMSQLSELLAVHGGFELFLQFMTKEFCSENLLFWRRVEDFRSGKHVSGPQLNAERKGTGTDSPKAGNKPGLNKVASIIPVVAEPPLNVEIERQQLAETMCEAWMIFNTFMVESHDGSPLEINISADIRSRAETRLVELQSAVDTLLASEFAPAVRPAEQSSSDNASSLVTAAVLPPRSPALGSKPSVKAMQVEEMQLVPPRSNSTVSTSPRSKPLTLRPPVHHTATASDVARLLAEKGVFSDASDAPPVASPSNRVSPSARNATAQHHRIDTPKRGSGYFTGLTWKQSTPKGASLPDETRTRMTNPFAVLIGDIRRVFDEAQSAVLYLMQTNSFVRFRNSPQFAEFVGTAEAWTHGGVVRVRTGRNSVFSSGGHDNLVSQFSTSGSDGDRKARPRGTGSNADKPVLQVYSSLDRPGSISPALPLSRPNLLSPSTSNHGGSTTPTAKFGSAHSPGAVSRSLEPP